MSKIKSVSHYYWKWCNTHFYRITYHSGRMIVLPGDKLPMTALNFMLSHSGRVHWSKHLNTYEDVFE